MMLSNMRILERRKHNVQMWWEDDPQLLLGLRTLHGKSRVAFPATPERMNSKV